MNVDEYALGWTMAAQWAGRDDLIADIGSPAYEKDKTASLITASALAQNAQGEAVAWRYWNERSKSWDSTTSKAVADVMQSLGRDVQPLYTHAERAGVPDGDRIDWMEANARSVSFGKAPQQGYWVHVQGVGYSHNESLRGAIDSAREAQSALAAAPSQPEDAT